MSFWSHFSMESRPKLLISGGSFTLPPQHTLLLLSFPEFAAIPRYLLTHSVQQLSSSSSLHKTFALTICRVDPTFLLYLEKKNEFSAIFFFFSQKSSAGLKFTLSEILGWTESWTLGAECVRLWRIYKVLPSQQHSCESLLGHCWGTASLKIFVLNLLKH